MNETPVIANMMDFTCICCRVAFKDGEVQRMHYKTDWHRYNLKRKVADLPPVTSEEFQRRVLSHQGNEALQTQSTSKYCKYCQKSFSNENAFSNHLNSKKHKENECNYQEKPSVDVESSQVVETQVPESVDEAMSCETDSEVEEVDSDEWDDEDLDVDIRQCLFCKHHSKSFMKNLKHMSVRHTFFIPDVEYCIDIRGFIEYLAQKIDQEFMCLWCNEKGKTYHTAEAARSHMLDKGHCKVLHEGVALAEYTDFYDYSSSYPDAQEANVNPDEEVENKSNDLDGNEYELVLPSGAVIGHRSLMRYYKQSIDPNRTTALVSSKSSKKLHKVLSSYRALGWTPAQQEVAARTARDVHYLKRMQSKYYTKLGVKANKFQKHFRQQVNF